METHSIAKMYTLSRISHQLRHKAGVNPQESFTTEITELGTEDTELFAVWHAIFRYHFLGDLRAISVSSVVLFLPCRGGHNLNRALQALYILIVQQKLLSKGKV